MSGNDDRDLPGADGHDAAVARAWRQASDERPPSRVDDAILAAARNSVREPGASAKAIHAAPRPRNKWMQWQPLLAAASVAGLAFVLVQMLPRDRDDTPRVRVEKQAPVAPGEVGERAVTPVQEPVTASAGGSVAKSTADESGLRSTSDGATDSRETDADLRLEAVPGMAASPAPAAAAPPAAPAARSLGNVAPVIAANRAARIAELHASGDAAAAAEALRAFRAADPDADTYLPESLRNWARTVE